MMTSPSTDPNSQPFQQRRLRLLRVQVLLVIGFLLLAQLGISLYSSVVLQQFESQSIEVSEQDLPTIRSAARALQVATGLPQLAAQLESVKSQAELRIITQQLSESLVLLEDILSQLGGEGIYEDLFIVNELFAVLNELTFSVSHQLKLANQMTENLKDLVALIDQESDANRIDTQYARALYSAALDLSISQQRFLIERSLSDIENRIEAINSEALKQAILNDIVPVQNEIFRIDFQVSGLQGQFYFLLAHSQESLKTRYDDIQEAVLNRNQASIKFVEFSRVNLTILMIAISLLAFIVLLYFKRNFYSRANTLLNLLKASDIRTEHFNQFSGHDELTQLAHQIGHYLTIIERQSSTIEEKHQQLERILSLAENGFAVVRENKVAFWNSHFSQATGWSQTQSFTDLPDELKSLCNDFRKNPEEADSTKSVSVRLHKKTYDIQLHAIVWENEPSVLLVMSDVSRRVADVTRAENKALRDPLTGLFNRQRYEQLSNDAMLEDYALVVMDIDSFKKYNDHYGHAAGDAAIRTVAKTIQKTIRASDIAIRYGGEEFVILLRSNLSTKTGAEAERIRAAVETLAIEHEKSPMGILTVSGGVTVHKPGQTLAECFESADQLLYQAKAEGRNKIVCKA